MTSIHLSLSDIYRASDVTRWQIVKTMRSQSVAEHSYQVAMITARICGMLDYDREYTARAVWYALIHDIPEVLTGDIVSPVKKIISTNALEQFEGSIRVLGSHVSEDANIRRVVKLADMLEAVKFLTENATTDHGRRVLQAISTKTSELARELEVTEVIDEILRDRGFIIGVDVYEP